jgi:hypothetical protein
MTKFFGVQDLAIFQQHFLSRNSLWYPAPAISPAKDYSDLRLLRLAAPPASVIGP